MISSGEIARRLCEIRSRIERAASRAGRGGGDVRLVAVTKTHPADLVRRAVAAGLSDFGENRVQEGTAKIEALRAEFPGLSWTLIGRLQTNKAKAAVQYFQEIQSVDRPVLAEKLAAEASRLGRRVPVLLEVNVGGEESKGGIAPESAEELLRLMLGLESLEPRGLMTVPPYSDDPEAARPHFRAVAALARRLRDRCGAPLPELSMGMSHDFDVAIEEGATVVRLGTALFGPREDA